VLSLTRGRYAARLAESPRDLAASLTLRARAFRTGRDDMTQSETDADCFDHLCRHVLVEDLPTGRLACSFRLLHLTDGSDIARTYSDQFYDLTALAVYPRPLVEIGRFCIDPDARDPDVLRVAWTALTRIVDGEGIGMMIGCSSFPGTDPGPYLDAFAQLRAAHLAPRRWQPRIRSPRVFRYARKLRLRTPDPLRAAAAMPPLLRTYLAMGGRVSDHAVVDADLGTLHVFTGIEVDRIPAVRAKALRAVAGT
jgi:L-ornithine Nalpha-acyltransferase